MNNSMSAKGQFKTTRYEEGNKLEKWFGRAYWISDELRPPFTEGQMKARSTIKELSERNINKKENEMFRKILHKGNYKYKKEDFIVEPKKYV